MYKCICSLFIQNFVLQQALYQEQWYSTFSQQAEFSPAGDSRQTFLQLIQCKAPLNPLISHSPDTYNTLQSYEVHTLEKFSINLVVHETGCRFAYWASRKYLKIIHLRQKLKNFSCDILQFASSVTWLGTNKHVKN